MRPLSRLDAGGSDRPSVRAADYAAPGAVFHRPSRAFMPAYEVAFLLVPGFNMVSFGAAIGPLRQANDLSPSPIYRWHLVSFDGRPVVSSSEVRVEVDHPVARAPAAELASPLIPSLAEVATTCCAISGDARASSAARLTSAVSRSSIPRLNRYSGRSMVTCPLPKRTPESTHCSWLPSSIVIDQTRNAPPTTIAEAVSTVRRR